MLYRGYYIVSYYRVDVATCFAINLTSAMFVRLLTRLQTPRRYAWKGGVGIAVNAYQNRLIGCYLDYSSLSVRDPSNLVVEATFFLATPAVFTTSGSSPAFLTGVKMQHNT